MAPTNINMTWKDDPAGHNTKSWKEQRTEKESGRKHIRMDRIRFG